MSLSKKQKWRAKKYGKQAIACGKTNWYLYQNQKGKEMIKKIYAVYDKKAKSELGLFEHPNDLVAIRDFSQLCAKEESPVCKFAEDYELRCLGQIDTDTCVITSDVKTIAEAVEYAKKD